MIDTHHQCLLCSYRPNDDPLIGLFHVSVSQDTVQTCETDWSVWSLQIQDHTVFRSGRGFIHLVEERVLLSWGKKSIFLFLDQIPFYVEIHEVGIR